MPRSTSDSERKAREVFTSNSISNPAELLELAKKLLAMNSIEYARRLLERAHESKHSKSPDLEYQIDRRLAIATYKTLDLPVEEKLKEAEKIIDNLLPRTSAADRQQELLGIKGSICKQRWQAFGLREHLHQSFRAYAEAMEIGRKNDHPDNFYTAINAAFVADLTAFYGSEAGNAMSAEAAEIRREIRDSLQQKWKSLIEELNGAETSKITRADLEKYGEDAIWVIPTLAEASFGLREYKTAAKYAAVYLATKPDKWQLETTARQMAHLAYMLHVTGGKAEEIDLTESEPGQVLKALLGGKAGGASSFLRGKVGLALSGGGFRASLFHIGVLARLAELDMLRHVEVISCVSGGSIIGAYYYLELRNLLTHNADVNLKRRHYVDLVQRVEKQFLEGVQRNLRLRMLLSSGSNWKVITARHSSMTDRLAELYEKELYSRIDDDKARKLSEMIIRPKDEPEGFSPKYDNWQRINKVPMVILNATTLNTCHNWQFTATYMGEPPARSIDSEIGGNHRLRRMYHEDAPPVYRPEGAKGIRLSQAVAASACVPGLFEPLVLDGLYGSTYDPNRFCDYVTRLVDGGNYDNQGVASLREQDCTVLLVSDASGQTGVELDPSGARTGVIQRSNNILMTRVREAQYQLLATLRDSGVLRGLMFVHLKKGLKAANVNWLTCPDRRLNLPPTGDCTEYGIRFDVQTQLAKLRTDLDSFSDAEADALMLSGYRMTDLEFTKCVRGFPKVNEPLLFAGRWRFGKISPIATADSANDATNRLLEALHLGEKLAFKPWFASPWTKLLSLIGLMALLCLAVFACYWSWSIPLRIGQSIASLAGALLVLALLRMPLVRLGYRNSYLQYLASVLLLPFGSALLWLHTRLIEPFYVRMSNEYRKN
jgi:predicted acylesterase/phospholipase RssA